MSKPLFALGLLALAGVPLAAGAQDAAVSVVPAEAGAAPSDAPSADSSAADSSSSSATYASGDSSSSSSSSEETGSDSGLVLTPYIGIDRVQATLDLSRDALIQRFGSDQLEGGFNRVRAGLRLLPGISAEVQGGFLPDKAEARDDARFKHFYGVYALTTGTILDTVEISGRIGYAWLGAKSRSGGASFDGFSYGANLELPVKNLLPSFPDLRLSGGAMVFTHEGAERSYGFDFGLRYDFRL